ncbi:MAG: serine/threonine-protein kinase [Chloroflexota bacterium]
MEINQINQQNQYNSGRYQLQEKLGQGGMGVVYRATDRLTGEAIALKHVTQLPQHAITSTGASQEDLCLALAYEFQILAGLRHPHIISVLDYGFGGLPADAQRQPFYTMTYLANGQDILAAAQGQPLIVKIDLIRQTLQALAYLHRREVLHRDLKPANVLVQQGDVRVLDFGLAATTDTANSSSAGTPLYMAPELFDGIPYSKAADLFAIGVLMTQLLTGRHPFAPFDYAFLDRVLDAEPNLNNMPASLAPIVRQLLAKEPEARYASANDVLLALQVAQVGGAVDGEAVIELPEMENETNFIISALNQLAWTAYCRGDYETMLDTYQQARNEFIENKEAASLTDSHETYESLAGIAWGHMLLASDDDSIDIEPCLNYLTDSQPIMDSTHPLRLHLICNEILTAMGDCRANIVLSHAHQRLQTHVGYIENPEWRQSFLEHVPENREILRRVENG